MKTTTTQKLQAFFSPCVKFAQAPASTLLIPSDDQSLKILKLFKPYAIFLSEEEYDQFLRFVSKFGLSVEVTYTE